MHQCIPTIPYTAYIGFYMCWLISNKFLVCLLLLGPGIKCETQHSICEIIHDTDTETRSCIISLTICCKFTEFYRGSNYNSAKYLSL